MAETYCGGLVDTTAPLYVAPASTQEPPYREEYVYRCAACGAEVQDIQGLPLFGTVRHDGLQAQPQAAVKAPETKG